MKVNLAWSQGNLGHNRTQNYYRLMLEYKKGEKRQRNHRKMAQNCAKKTG